MNNGNVYLIGYRCTGKTSVGRGMAESTGLFFVDTDELFVERSGLDVSEYVLLHGWNSFRRLESEILRDLARKTGRVVATGGGVVLESDNVRLMKETGRVIWLRTSWETIYRRMTSDPVSVAMRPGLTGLPLAEEIKETLASREPLYRAAMDESLETDDLSVDEVCARVRALTDTEREK